MGKAPLFSQQFQLDMLGARAPQSYRSGIVTPSQAILGGRVVQAAANERAHPLRNGEAAAQEEAFWHGAYLREPYYVAGRSYAQYRPAYALGWQAGFDFSASQFAQIEKELEQRWESHDTSSLLEWSQVRDGVHAAWMRARMCQERNAQVSNPVQLAVQLRPLQRLQLHTAHDLTLWLHQADPAPTAFVRQVVERHIQMLQEFSNELPQSTSISEDWANPFLRIGTTMHCGWMRLRGWVQDIDTGRVLQLCDEREQHMLTRYEALLTDQHLPTEMSSLLKRQLTRLQLHHTKLHWVRQQWLERG